MRYFTCSLCRMSNVRESDIGGTLAHICDDCRESRPKETRELDDAKYKHYQERMRLRTPNYYD